MGPDPTRLASELETPAGFEAALLEELRTRVGYDVAFFSVKGGALGRHFDRVRLVPVMEAAEAYSPSSLRNVGVIGA